MLIAPFVAWASGAISNDALRSLFFHHFHVHFSFTPKPDSNLERKQHGRRGQLSSFRWILRCHLHERWLLAARSLQLTPQEQVGGCILNIKLMLQQTLSLIDMALVFSWE